MKKGIQILLMVILTSSAKAQFVNDSVSMLPGYTNESYYNFENGEILNVDNTTWDLAFDLSGLGASVRVNDHTSVKVAVYPNGDKTDWETVDTAGITTWNTYNNSETDWNVGALDQSNVAGNFADLGWGVYNTITHAITGDSIHILTLATGETKKLMIEQLVGGTFTFKHANLDGSNEITQTLTKSDYPNKRFAYYSVLNDQIIDREPAIDSWDLVFTKYISTLSPGVTYGVTGALINEGVKVRKAEGVDPSMAEWEDYQEDSLINVIGYDWKSFNMGTFSFVIAPDLSYFVQDLSGNLWHLLFTKFEGSSSGKIVFSKNKIATVALEDNEIFKSLALYPNPASENINVIYDVNDAAHLSITNLYGQNVYQELVSTSGFNAKQIDVSLFESGVYILTISVNNAKEQLKFIVK